MNTQDSQSELETIVADIIADARSIDVGFAADEPNKYQAALNDGIKAVEAYVTTRVKEAVSVGIYNVHDLLFAYGKECEDNGVLSEKAVTIRMDLSAYYHDQVTTTTNGKEDEK